MSNHAFLMVHGIGDFSPGLALASAAQSLQNRFPNLESLEETQDAAGRTRSRNYRSDGGTVRLVEYHWSGTFGKLRRLNPLRTFWRVFALFHALPSLGAYGSNQAWQRRLAVFGGWALRLSAMAMTGGIVFLLASLAMENRAGETADSARVNLAIDILILSAAVPVVAAVAGGLMYLLSLSSAGRQSGRATQWLGLFLGSVFLLAYASVVFYAVLLLVLLFFETGSPGLIVIMLLVVAPPFVLLAWLLLTAVDLLRDVVTYLAPRQDGSDNAATYSIRVEFSFTDRDTLQFQTWTLATDLEEGAAPVFPPDRMIYGTSSQLVVKHQRQTCAIVGTPFGPSETCSAKQTYFTSEWGVRIYPAGRYCSLGYDRTDFELENAGDTGFERAAIDEQDLWLVETDAGTSPEIRAEGYEAYGDSFSSFPAWENISLGEQFAVFNNDCVTGASIYGPSASCGTDVASALRWPRVTGTRNGHTFSYSCELPSIVRDLLQACPTEPNTFYKLPFSGGTPTWWLSQGNDGDFTHNGGQRYAFDFAAGEGTTVRAARGGEVTVAIGDNILSSYYYGNCDICGANMVTIRHQDGLVTEYYHFMFGGVSVTEGQFVERGQIIGYVGSTGYSTGPHVHFQQRVAGESTRKLRFEMLTVDTPEPPFSCYIPQEGDALISDNNGP